MSDGLDIPPVPAWAMIPSKLKENIGQLEEYAVPGNVLSKQSIIGQLWVEATDRASRNQSARIKALELIAELSGYKETFGDTPSVPTDNLTEEEIKYAGEYFESAY